MKRANALLVIALAAASTPALCASGTEPDEVTPQMNRELAQAFIRCAATYEWASESMGMSGKRSAAQYMHELANGARTSAASLLSQAEVQEGKPNRTIGSWDDFIRPQVESGLTRVKALAEVEDSEGLQTEMEICTGLNELQAEIVNSLRRQRTAPP